MSHREETNSHGKFLSETAKQGTKLQISVCIGLLILLMWGKYVFFLIWRGACIVDDVSLLQSISRICFLLVPVLLMLMFDLLCTFQNMHFCKHCSHLSYSENQSTLTPSFCTQLRQDNNEFINSPPIIFCQNCHISETINV